MNMNHTQNKYLTPIEAADRLAISTGTIRRLVKENKLEAYRFGNQIRIAAESLDSYIERQKITLQPSK